MAGIYMAGIRWQGKNVRMYTGGRQAYSCQPQPNTRILICSVRNLTFASFDACFASATFTRSILLIPLALYFRRYLVYGVPH